MNKTNSGRTKWVQKKAGGDVTAEIELAIRRWCSELGHEKTAELIEAVWKSMYPPARGGRPKRNKYRDGVAVLLADPDTFKSRARGEVIRPKRGAIHQAAKRLKNDLEAGIGTSSGQREHISLKGAEKRVLRGFNELQKEVTEVIMRVLSFGKERGASTFDEALKKIEEAVKRGEIPPARSDKT